MDKFKMGQDDPGEFLVNKNIEDSIKDHNDLKILELINKIKEKERVIKHLESKIANQENAVDKLSSENSKLRG